MNVRDDAKPVILVVEDEDEARKARSDALVRENCTVVSVASSDEALRELRAAPAVDLVLTDINLAPTHGGGGDKSGVALARFVKSTYGDLPVAGYSAVFHEEQMPDADQYFDRLLGKGEFTFKNMPELWEWCRNRALEHRHQRQTTAFELRDLLKQRHVEAHPPAELLRELRPGVGGATGVEAALSEAGYRLRLVEAEGLAKPIIVWLLAVADGVEAEVYGQPALYSFGTDDDEAVDQVLELMHLLRAEAGADAPEAVGPALSLTEFLHDVIANADEQ